MGEKKTLNLPLIGNIILTKGHSVLGIILGIIAGGILILISGVNPFDAYGAMLRGAFRNWASFTNVLVRSSPLLLGGIGVAIGIKSGLWNTGIEGFMYLGGIGAAIVSTMNLGLPPGFRYGRHGDVHGDFCYGLGASLWKKATAVQSIAQKDDK